MPTVGALTLRGIGGFWAPLALNALLLALAGPMLNLVVVRAAAPTTELAAFWLAFSVAMLAQTAALAVQPVSVMALGHGPGTRPLVPVALAVGSVSSALVLTLAATPVRDALFGGLIPTSARVARCAGETLAVLAALPLLVAVRGAAVGMAIAARRTPVVLGGAVLRLAVLGAVGAALAALRGGGAVAAAWALVAGTAAETGYALAATVAAWRARRAAEPRPGPRAVRGVLRAGAPLAVSALAWTATRPLVAAVLGRLADPELAQAGFGVVLPILFLTCAPLWVLQDVCLVLPRDRGELRTVVRFAATGAAASTLAILAVAASPPLGRLLQLGFAPDPALAATVRPALAWMAMVPFPLAGRAVAQGILLRSGRGGPWLVLAPLRLASMAAVGLAVVAWRPATPGAVLAVALLLGGDVLDVLAAGRSARRVLERGEAFAQSPDADVRRAA